MRGKEEACQYCRSCHNGRERVMQGEEEIEGREGEEGGEQYAVVAATAACESANNVFLNNQ